MKLRNKKTGQIYEVFNNTDGTLPNTLAELNEEWEDYKPTEPLIKDEKIRKAVKAWVEMLDIKDSMRYCKLHGISGHYLSLNKYSIDVPNIEGLKDLHYYTITELCGEEE